MKEPAHDLDIAHISVRIVFGAVRQIVCGQSRHDALIAGGVIMRNQRPEKYHVRPAACVHAGLTGFGAEIPILICMTQHVVKLLYRLFDQGLMPQQIAAAGQPVYPIRRLFIRPPGLPVLFGDIGTGPKLGVIWKAGHVQMPGQPARLCL